MKISTLLSVLGVALGLALACTSEGGGSSASDPEACQAIIDACHPKDDGSDEAINGCHSAAHDDDTETCNARLEECVALCDAAPPVGGGYDTGDGSTGGGGSTGDGDGTTTGGDETADGSTGDPSACVAHCECMTATCSASEGYPYASEQDCLDACAALGDFELSCYGMWCEAAAISPDPLHLCEHAWGSVGTSKC